MCTSIELRTTLSKLRAVLTSLILAALSPLQELSTLRSSVSEERSARTAMGEQVAKMNQMLASAQEALQQEQRTVQLLTEQIKVDKVRTRIFTGSDR